MVEQEREKKCRICGDKAFSNNFDALTCESCKAFFRRNAIKAKKYKCHFDNNCKIDITTRRNCKCCRLKKCLDIGMKKDWILTPEAKKERKLKIEMNKIKRKSSHSSKSNDSLDINSPGNTNIDHSSQAIYSENSPEITNSQTIDNTSEEMPQLLNLDLDFDIEVINTEIQKIENYIENNEKITEISDTVSVPVINTSLQTLQQNSETFGLVLDSNIMNRSIENNIIDTEERYEISNIVYQKAVDLEFSVLSIARPLTDYRNNFNELEGMKLTELLNATHILMKPNTYKAPTLESFSTTCKEVSNKIEQGVSKIIQMCKSLTAFKGICANDQISLVKYGIIEVYWMRSIETYHPENQCFDIILNNDTSIIMNLDLLKQISNDFYSTITIFLKKLCPEWDSDVIILNLLTAIVLFNPDRPNLLFGELVKLQQHIYMHLLKRYLLLKYRSECTAKLKFLKLLNSLIDLEILGKMYLKKYETKDPEKIAPILREIFGIKLNQIENNSNTEIRVC